MACARAGNTEHALELLGKGMGQYPHNAYFAHSAGVLHSKAGADDEAERCFRLALSADPANSPALLGLARVKARKGEHSAASAAFSQATQGEGRSNAAAWNAWAQFERSRGDLARARSLLDCSLQENPMHEATLHALAMEAVAEERYGAAVSALQAALRLNPSHAPSWTTLAEIAHKQGDPIQARRLFEGAERCGAADAVMYSTWAAMEARMADQGRAHELLQLSLALDPSNMHSWVQLATLCTRAPFLRASTSTVFERAFAADVRLSGNIHLLGVYAQFLLQSGYEERGDAVLRGLHTLAPDNARIARALALRHIQRGERDAAARLLRHGMQVGEPQGVMLCAEELARLAELEGRPEVARQLFQHAVAKARPPTARLLREWGLLERRHGSASAARALFRRSLRVNAMDVRTRIAWALLERSLGNVEDALELLRKALDVAPRVSMTWYLYCDTATTAFAPDACRSIFKEAHRFVPRCPQLALLEGMYELREGRMDAARAAFRRGSKHARGGAAGECYAPLFQAWAQLEEAAGAGAHAAALRAEYERIEADERRGGGARPERPEQEGFPMDGPGILDVVDMSMFDGGEGHLGTARGRREGGQAVVEGSAARLA